MGIHGGIFSFVHAVLLLAVSFFVILAAHRADSSGIKTFGYAIAVLLCVASAVTFAAGLVGRHQMMARRMHMWGKMCNPTMSNQVQPQANNPVIAK